MAFVIIDGVIANSTFDPAAPLGNSRLVDGIHQQEFSPSQNPSAQPVDAFLGLSTWAAANGSISLNNVGQIISAEDFGQTTIALGLPVNGLVSNETVAGAANLIVNSIASVIGAEKFGAVNAGMQQTLTGISSAEKITTPALGLSNNVSSLASAESVNNAISIANYQSSNILSTEIVGFASFASVAPAAININATAINSDEAFGVLETKAHVNLSCASSAEFFGATQTVVAINAGSITGAEFFGTQQSNAVINTSAIVSGESIGVIDSKIIINAGGIASDAVINNPVKSIIQQASHVLSFESFGHISINADVAPVLNHFQSGHYYRRPIKLDPGYFVVFPNGIKSQEAFGNTIIQLVEPPKKINRRREDEELLLLVA